MSRLHVLSRTLRFRRERHKLFQQGRYQAVEAAGARADHAFAFVREHGDDAVLVVVSRLAAGLIGTAGEATLSPDAWLDTRLTGLPASNGWVDELTGRQIDPEVADGQHTLEVGKVLGQFPVALLSRL